MRINPITTDKKCLKAASKNEAITTPLKIQYSKDTFEKAAPSFKGTLEPGFSDEELIGVLIERYPELLAEMAAESIMQEYMDEMHEVIELFIQEAEFDAYLTAVTSKNAKKLIKLLQIDVPTFNKTYLADAELDMKLINGILSACNIKSFNQINNFLACLNANKETRSAFKDQEIEAIMIYSTLNSKSQFSRFGELLLYRFNEEAAAENPSVEGITFYAEFLDKLNVKDLNDFKRQFAHLAPKFNNFESMADISDAVDYIHSTYDEKISLLDTALKGNPETQKLSAETMYGKMSDIIDVLYEQNAGLGDLGEYISIAASFPKIKGLTKKVFGPSFDNFETPEAKIDFCRILKESNVSIKEVNSLAEKPIIEDSDPIDFLFNCEFSTDAIADLKSGDKKNAKEIYVAFKDSINALYKSPDEDTKDLDNFLKVIDKFDIKSSGAFLNFYNNALRSKNKTITKDELKEFVGLFALADSKTVLENSKKQKTGVIPLLRKEKAKEDAAKQEIEAFLQEDKTGYFIGKSSDEIYYEYKTQIDAAPDNIRQFLSDIIKFEIANSADYHSKTQKIDEFSKYFENREALLKFISNAKFKFDNSNEDERYRQSALTVLNDVSSICPNSEDTKRRLNYFIKTNFFSRSAKTLPDFVDSFTNERQRTFMLNAIADKKVSSINALNRFFESYKDDKGNTSNLKDFLLRLPVGITFNEATTILEKLSEAAQKVNSPVKVNNENINNIDMRYFKQHRELDAKGLNKLLCSINGHIEQSSFIGALPNSFNANKPLYSKFRIAQEIVNKVDASDESYRNLIEKMKLDKQSLNINQDASDYAYMKALEKIIPNDFANFVNSNDWLDFNNDGNIPNFSLHAKLRLIDRFIMGDVKSVSEVYSDKSKQKLKDIVKSIYTNEPTNIRGTDKTKRIVFDTETDFGKIETVALNTGEVVTVIPH